MGVARAKSKSKSAVDVADQLCGAASDAMVITGRDGRVVNVNPPAEKLFGYSQEQLLGQKADFLMPRRYRNFNVKRHPSQVGWAKIRPLGHGLESVAYHSNGTRFRVVMNLGLIEIGSDTLVSATVQKVPGDWGDELDLRAIVEASDDAIIGTDLNGIIVSWNKGAEKICGYTAKEILGESVTVLLPPGHFNEHTQNLMRVRRGEHFHFETTRIHKDGHPINLSITVAPVRRKDGTLVGASVVARDITRQKELLGLRAIVEASDDAIIGETMDGTIMSWNHGAEKIYGYRAEEIVGRSRSVLIPPGRQNEFRKIKMRLERGEHIDKFETKRIHKDGHPIDVSLTISPVKTKDGTVVCASVVARDITQQKQTQNALRQSEERFHVALKNAPVVIFSQDLQLRFTWINSPRLFPIETYLGRNDAEIFPGDEGARIIAIKKEVLRTGMGAHTEVTVTVMGKKHYFDLVIEPRRDDTGKLIGLLCSAIDITFLKETIIRLQNVLNEVQQLRGLLPICANCKRIRDERETWQALEVYIQAHSEAKFSHGLCPDCLRELYPEQYQKWATLDAGS